MPPFSPTHAGVYTQLLLIAGTFICPIITPSVFIRCCSNWPQPPRLPCHLPGVIPPAPATPRSGGYHGGRFDKRIPHKAAVRARLALLWGDLSQWETPGQGAVALILLPSNSSPPHPW